MCDWCDEREAEFSAGALNLCAECYSDSEIRAEAWAEPDIDLSQEYEGATGLAGYDESYDYNDEGW